MKPIAMRIERSATSVVGLLVTLLAVSPTHAATLLSGANCGASTVTTTGTATGQVLIGCLGTGSLEINASATGNGITTVNANATGSISVVSGLGNGGNGSILVNGNGTAGSATLNSFHSIEIGFPSAGIGGTGSLTVLNGGLVQVTGTDPFSGYNINLGNTNSTGVVTVDGAGSVLKSRGSIDVGNQTNSTGTLTISNGGLVQAAGSSANDNRTLIGTGGSGSVLVTGNGSTLVTTSVLLGNGAGTAGGSVTVEDGGLISIQALGSGFYDNGLIVGADNSSTATVTVTGAGSSIEVDPITSGFAAGKEVVIGGFGKGTLIVDDAATVDASGANVRVSGSYNGTTTTSPGLLTVKNGASLTADTVTVYGNGTLNGDGAIYGNVILNGGTIAPGNSPGTLTIGGDYTQQVAGDLVIEIAGNNAGEFDVLNVLGTATFAPGSNISLVFTNGFAPSAGDVFDFLVAGVFASNMSLVDINIAGLQTGFQFDVGFTNAGTFNLTAVNDGVSVVPVPAAFWLFGSAVGVIAVMRRKATS